MGAVRLSQSLLPKLASLEGFYIAQVFVSRDSGGIDWCLFGRETQIVYIDDFWEEIYRDSLNAVLGRRFDGQLPLLVMGDMPIRCKSEQIVFLQNRLLLEFGLRKHYCSCKKYSSQIYL